MEILINGKPINESELKQPANFAQFIDRISRMVSAGRHIISGVTVDGREIIAWDRETLDLGGISKVEVHSQSMQDYAVSNLGNLGDYTGEVLSVLRNIETICAKQGFDVVRKQLLEGLDYILTVIENSDTVLKFNLEQSRYDMRSGRQMLNEVQSLKKRITGAMDFASSRKLFEELEFTLTDWLKFLEILLRRYGDRQGEIGNSAEVTDEAHAQIEALELLQKDVKTIVEDLYSGRIAKSMDQFQNRIRTLQESLTYIQRLAGAGRIDYQRLVANNQSMAQKIPEITKILSELSDSIQIGDTVLMRDILEYEILPFVGYLRQIFEQILIQQEKA